jgi:penicillin-binding protein 1C
MQRGPTNITTAPSRSRPTASPLLIGMPRSPKLSFGLRPRSCRQRHYITLMQRSARLPVQGAAPLLFHIFDLLPPEPISPIAVQSNAGGLARHVGAALKRFIPWADVLSTAANRQSPPPRITFPPNGAHLVLARDGSSFAPLALEAMGGAPPYRWAVNGQPLAPTPIGAPTSWMPDGPGFVRISVTDHHNNSITAEVWIE